MIEQEKMVVTGRCYCGKHQFTAAARPISISYCHCSDCRRVTGAPLTAFAAFDEGAFTITPDEGRAIEATKGVKRTFCGDCGSPITGRYDYFPGQVFVSIGLLDQADQLEPNIHSHYENKLTWLCLEDKAERSSGSSRGRLGS